MVAIVVAGIWTYRIFVRHRKAYPRLKLSHRTNWWDVDDKHRILRVTLDLKNESEVRVCLTKGHTWIQQMKPWPHEVAEKVKAEQKVVEEGEREIRWPLLEETLFDFEGQQELEPQESDELVMEYVLPKTIEQVIVYTYIENEKKPGRNIGWTLSTVVDFKGGLGTGIAPSENQGQSKRKPQGPKKSGKQ